MNAIRSAAYACALVIVGVSATGVRADEVNCGPLQNGYGPFDYRTATRDQITLVEAYHFTPKVEALIEGKTSNAIAADITYTLRAFPNHSRALMSLSRLAQRDRREVLPGAQYPTDCYFDRAIRFQPEDPMPYMIFGLHLVRTGRGAEAGRYLERADQLSDGDPNLHYNLGLAYFDLHQFDKAMANAKRAYDGGFPLPGLRDRLRKAGAWHD